MDASTTASLLAQLPQELYDQIHDIVFAKAPNSIILVDKTYKPPVQLCLTRAVRDTTAITYYRDHEFRFNSVEMACAWLKSLPASHIDLIHRVSVFTTGTERYSHCSVMVEMFLQAAQMAMEAQLKENGIELHPGVLSTYALPAAKKNEDAVEEAMT